ncbi:hypothetical protein [Brevibacterium spongiae]|uniref:Uncharacterized protein n=1 Tax=Brevibacterium spongiae TaxID=2909672 RepID=A0ABY5SPZ4_9MICO|nr:hypothetical protein [Brevibacterium spongiae]UVI36613.1 hypothetical protein L1F31_02795 [Brevibacterium spongiae]
MKSTIRNRAAALGIATVAGLAGLGLASGPAMAADASLADSSSQSASSGVDAQSVYYPTNSTDYANELVRAWGTDNTDRVEAFASGDVAEQLADHDGDDATHWDQTGGERTGDTTYVTYENTVTGEKMALGVSEKVIDDQNEWGSAPHAVTYVQFAD